MALTAGQYITKKMDDNGLTTTDVKVALGLVSSANISDWRSDRRPIPQRHVRQLATVLRCDYSTLNAKNGGNKSKVKATKNRGHTPVAVEAAEIPVKKKQPSLNGWTPLTASSLPNRNDYVHLYCAKVDFYYVGPVTHNPASLVGSYTHFMKVQRPELPKV